MSKHNVTFVVFTYNEESRLERVIKNFKDFGDILIADNKSIDRTQEIARAYGCGILNREKNYTFVENQEMVDLIFNTVKTDWIYWAFADEMLEKKTLIKITDIIAANKYDIINIDRKNYSEGEFCYNVFHTRTNKAFKRGAIDFSDNVIHQMGKPIVSKSRIYFMDDKDFIHHFTSNTISEYIKIVDRYTEAELSNNEKPQESFIQLLWQITKRFLKNYFYEKGYKAKYAGLQVVLTFIFYELIKNIKLYEHINGLNRSTIEKKYDKQRDEILKQFEV